MRWPWTSVARLDEAHATLDETHARLEDAWGERQWLRARVEHLENQLTRIQRRKAGLSEVPKPPRPRLEPMPRELRDHIRAFASKAIQKDLRDRAYRRHAQGEPWDGIMEDLMRDEDPLEMVTIGGPDDTGA